DAGHGQLQAAVNSIKQVMRSLLSMLSLESGYDSYPFRQLDQQVKARLRVRAAQHGRSMEDEAREILRSALSGPPSQTKLGQAIRQRFGRVGSVDITLPRRDALRPASFFRR